ncbi:MAG: hypothetical protein JJT96_20970 [Opitutales bacterium]|nr:hypothetical protein [Opitutales bacterium]
MKSSPSGGYENRPARDRPPVYTVWEEFLGWVLGAGFWFLEPLNCAEKTLKGER